MAFISLSNVFFGYSDNNLLNSISIAFSDHDKVAIIGDNGCGNNQPDLLILDEPTNNLEIKSISILEDALNQYTGAILLVSHDETFVKNINIDKTISISK